MKIIGIGVLHTFCVKHADCRKWISNWILDTRSSRWETTHDIKNRYPSASFLEGNVVIFNVRGNTYRLETQVAFLTSVVAVKWMGTHSEYDHRNK